MVSQSEFHVTIRVRNNRLLSRRKELGVNQKVMAQAIGVNLADYGGLETCRDKPIKEGVWTRSALLIAEYWDVDPEELFPDGILSLNTNKVERAVDKEAMLAISGSTPNQLASVIELETNARIGEILTTLTPREQEVVKRYNAFGDYDHNTLKQIGEALEDPVSPERVRQIYLRALLKLRHGARSRYILGTGPSELARLSGALDPGGKLRRIKEASDIEDRVNRAKRRKRRRQ